MDIQIDATLIKSYTRKQVKGLTVWIVQVTEKVPIVRNAEITSSSEKVDNVSLATAITLVSMNFFTINLINTYIH